MRWHIPRYNSSSADHRPFTDFDPTNNGGMRADRCTPVYPRLRDTPIAGQFWHAIWIHCAWAKVIREHTVGTTKHAIINGDTVINGDTILNLYVIADLDLCVDINPLAEDAVSSDDCVFTNLAIVPNFRAGTYLRMKRNVSGSMYKHILLQRILRPS